MKIAYKASGVMALLSVLTLLVVMFIFSVQNERQAISSTMTSLSFLTAEISQKVGTRLEEKAAISLAFSSAPVISDALIKSNHEYESILAADRDEKIEQLNTRWKETDDINDSFIQQYLNNYVANYLKLQQLNMPDLYGEIFLTNRFGVMVASTGKLTTLAHAHKYWWKKAYDDGQGKIFFDDRGFDKSVAGYVIGIVIPIIVDDEIVGILKSNINVQGLLKQIESDFSQNNLGKVKIVRSDGLIVAAEGVIPLSSSLPDQQVQFLDRKKNTQTISTDAGHSHLMSFSPVSITMGSEKYEFGGVAGSIGHSKGNVGEGWHVIIALDENDALATVAKTRESIIIVGLGFIFLIAISALFLGKKVTRPLVTLTESAKDIGRGNFNVKADDSSNDEIGVLASAFNKMAVDLSETMVLRDALRVETMERKDLNDLLLESVSEGIFGVDSNEEITFINSAAARMLGCRVEEVIGQPLSLLLSVDQNDGSFLASVRSAIAGEFIAHDTHQNKFETCSHKDGSSFLSEYTVNSIKHEDQALGAVITFRDITEREKSAEKSVHLQRQLQQSQKMDAIGHLTGGLAHDFNNMLAAILGYTNLAIDACGQDRQAQFCGQSLKLKDYLNEVIKAGDRSKKLVAQMLAFSRGEIGEIKCLNLSKFTVDVMQMLRATIPTSIELVTNLPEENVYVETDTVQLNQVIMNLVINARDAIESQKGVIEVSVSTAKKHRGYCSSCHESYSGDYVRMIVSDSGSGMDDEIVAKVFDPFFTTKGVGSGTGMGLSMVHGIVHASGGHIRLETGQDKGTIITLFFPAVSVQDIDADGASDTSIGASDSTTGRIMVVDDEKLLGTLMNKQLSQAGYDVTVFDNPLDALNAFEKSPQNFDLVITDQTMPEMTGDELTRQLVTIRKDIPVILSTGYSSTITEEGAVKIGVAHYLEKPYEKEELLLVVTELIKAK